MNYPPHVEKLLAELSPSEAKFQRRCIEGTHGITILVGMLLGGIGVLALAGLYYFELPFAMEVFGRLATDTEIVAHTFYSGLSLAAVALGFRMIRS